MAALYLQQRAISIHAPREGSDLAARTGISGVCVFQSTLPVRGATTATRKGDDLTDDFNPRSP